MRSSKQLQWYYAAIKKSSKKTNAAFGFCSPKRQRFNPSTRFFRKFLHFSFSFALCFLFFFLVVFLSPAAFHSFSFLVST
ncbi:unnamed protein product [Coffea canephora]|uniref:Uncharacterized protein n=1 Tax=Coffea canephora TaxID=49390 RepID=A0A068UHX3_COFCA|nr:unnamed protein product [Coffea canephora]